jgi:hypothetical protein
MRMYILSIFRIPFTIATIFLLSSCTQDAPLGWECKSLDRINPVKRCRADQASPWLTIYSMELYEDGEPHFERKNKIYRYTKGRRSTYIARTYSLKEFDYRGYVDNSIESKYNANGYLVARITKTYKKGVLDLTEVEEFTGRTPKIDEFYKWDYIQDPPISVKYIDGKGNVR